MGAAVKFAPILLLFLASLAVAQAGPRVASLNACTDQLVLALADDAQIAGLSPHATNPAFSHYHVRAQQFPALSGTAEDALILKADVVVTSAFARPITRALLTASGTRLETFANAQSLADVRSQILRMGEILVQAERAKVAVARIDAALASVAKNNRGDQRPRILPLERRGWITGGETLLTDLLGHVGADNLGAALTAHGTRLPLEQIILLKPDRLLMTSALRGSEDQGTGLLHHPALAGFLARKPIMIPADLLVCGGPMQADAIDMLAAALTDP